MATTYSTAPLTHRPGTSGRHYVLEGSKVIHTARSLGDALEFIYGPQGWEGPSCSICDGLGHGFPGGGPCPLEDRGWADALDDARMGW